MNNKSILIVIFFIFNFLTENEYEKRRKTLTGGTI